MKSSTRAARSSSRRVGVLTASTLAGALTLAGFLSMVPAANAEGSFSCAELMPGLGNSTVAGFDNNTNIFVGGNFAVKGTAAEAEGRIVVMGNADFSKTEQSHYNVGEVGVGSWMVPTPGSEMLLVGGNVSSNGTTIDVGFRTAQGGAVRIKGANNVPTGKLVTNGGALTVPDAAAVSEHSGVATALIGSSAQFSTLTDTGAVVLDKWSVVLHGDGVSSTQVFTVDGSTLGTSATSVSLQLKGVPSGARVVVNVTGGPTAGLFFNSLLDGVGTPMDTGATAPAESAFGAIAANLVWNFETASNVTIGGLAQVPGSILVPTAGGVTEISAPGTNGRILVAGDLTHVGNGSGSEMHAYPLIGHELFGCKVPGLPTEEVTKPEIKPEIKPDTKPEIKPDTKPEIKPETTEEPVLVITPAPSAKSSTGSAAAGDTGTGLAVTGASASSVMLLGGSALVLLGLGVFSVSSLRRRH
ncbi:choice-of-anchor A family protein [Arthrobacter sp. GMC3]|uniref:choice-of-anchor A family protein n=1 Tax=Arthrobacter sp. GMC3 TaxID=2058894 RepID=UPI0011AFEEC7|nr:choice-of-anchor A family protein [Arthrobacter sp. GMC3]